MEKTQETDDVCIGANGVTAQYFLAYALPKWKEQFPNLRFQLVTGSTATLLEKLESHQIHVAFIQYVHREGIFNELLLDNAVKLVKHCEHPLPQYECIEAKELAQQKLVFLSVERLIGIMCIKCST